MNTPANNNGKAIIKVILGISLRTKIEMIAPMNGAEAKRVPVRAAPNPLMARTKRAILAP